MEKIIAKIRQYSDVLLVFAAAMTLFLIHPSYWCPSAAALDFDNQNFLVWLYSAWRGQLPPADLVYYYGYLFYARGVWWVMGVLFSVLIPLILTGYYVLFRSLSRSKLFAVASVIVLALAGPALAGNEAFIRYAVGSLFFLVSFLVMSQKPSRLLVFGLGLVAGFLLFFITDQGLYAVMAFLLASATFGWVRVIQARDNIFPILRTLAMYFFSFGVGWLIGAVPLLAIIWKTNSFTEFQLLFSTIAQASNFAKIPFSNFGVSISSSMGFVVLWIAGMVVAYLFARPTLPTKHAWVLAAAWSYTLILEQKNIIRPLGHQLTFSMVILVLLLCLILDNVLRRSFSSVFRTLVFLLILLNAVALLGLPKPQQIFTDVATKQLRAWRTGIPTEICGEHIFSRPEKLVATPSQQQVVQWVKNQTSLNQNNTKIFSFPADPLFYVLLNQPIPPLINAYDGSPEAAQRYTIEYITQANTEYVIWNVQNYDMDSVPYMVRAPLLTKFILTNYTPVAALGEYIVLQKSAAGTQLIELQNYPTFSLHLAQLYLGYLPQTYGRFEWDNLKNLELAPHVIRPVATQSAQLQFTAQEAQDIIFAVTSADAATTSLTFTLDNTTTTTVSWQACSVGSTPCLVKLSHVPMVSTAKEHITASPSANVHTLELYKEK